MSVICERSLLENFAQVVCRTFKTIASNENSDSNYLSAFDYPKIVCNYLHCYILLTSIRKVRCESSFVYFIAIGIKTNKFSMRER